MLPQLIFPDRTRKSMAAYTFDVAAGTTAKCYAITFGKLRGNQEQPKFDLSLEDRVAFRDRVCLAYNVTNHLEPPLLRSGVVPAPLLQLACELLQQSHRTAPASLQQQIDDAITTFEFEIDVATTQADEAPRSINETNQQSSEP